MGSRLRRNLRDLLVTAGRGVAVFAIAAKLLMPLGYMPAALADGGIALCDAHLAAESMPMHAMHGAEHASPADSDHARAHGDDDGGTHHEWQYCPLGALASAAAVAIHWQVPATSATPTEIATTETARPYQRLAVAFRSRAPPPAHSS